MAATGIQWLLLAYNGCYWHTMAVIDIQWLLLAYNGCYWHTMAVTGMQFGICPCYRPVAAGQT